MTRFARAEGSKSSNKKTLEDPTPWDQMRIKEKTKVPKVEGKIKKKKESNKSIEELIDKEYLLEEGVKYKVFKKRGKKDVKKPWFDLPFEENEYMTRYKNFYVKKEIVKELDEYSKSLEKEGLDKQQIANKMLTKERRAHKVLRLELLREQIGEASKVNGEDKGIKVSQNLSRTFKRENIPFEKPSHGRNQNQQFKKPRTELHFEENSLMTLYEDHWVLKECVPNLQVIYNKKVQRIISARMDGNRDPTLTEAEELILRRLMKKEKRREHRMLRLKLIEFAQSQNGEPSKLKKDRKPGKYLGINYETGHDMVKFDGFWIKKDGAERLEGLKEKLKSGGVSEEEIQKIMKNERRKEERLLKNEKKQFCFRCRQSGHMISLCPQNADDIGSTGVEICFKCGSTEHMARSCPSNKSGTGYALATCFICREVGHISRECPDNPRGLYPEGGCCNECGSVEHLKKDCPIHQSEQQKDTIKLLRLNNKESIEMEVDFPENEEEDPVVPTKKHKKKKEKVVVF